VPGTQTPPRREITVGDAALGMCIGEGTSSTRTPYKPRDRSAGAHQGRWTPSGCRPTHSTQTHRIKVRSRLVQQNTRNRQAV